MVVVMSLPPLISTPRLHLRDPRAGDAEAAFAAYTSDPAVVRYLGWPRHETVSDTARAIGFDIHRRLKGSAWVWAMTLKAPADQAGVVFGQVELVPQTYPSDQTHHLRLGYAMAVSHWGQGLMAEAVQAVLQVALSQPHVWRVDAWCDVDNHASAALLERVGMQREGCLRRAVLHTNVSDTPRDVWVYALTRGDGLSRQEAPASAADRAGTDQSR
jgi:ribosomal-protein-alanine N-acetyltransferase